MDPERAAPFEVRIGGIPNARLDGLAALRREGRVRPGTTPGAIARLAPVAALLTHITAPRSESLPPAAPNGSRVRKGDRP